MVHLATLDLRRLPGHGLACAGVAAFLEVYRDAGEWTPAGQCRILHVSTLKLHACMQGLDPNRYPVGPLAPGALLPTPASAELDPDRPDRWSFAGGSPTNFEGNPLDDCPPGPFIAQIAGPAFRGDLSGLEVLVGLYVFGEHAFVDTSH